MTQRGGGGDGLATLQPDELKVDSVDPEDAPTLGTFFPALMWSSHVSHDLSSCKSALLYSRHLRQYLISSLAKISLLWPSLDHSLLNAHNMVTLLWQMEDLGDWWQPQCLLGSEGHLQMLQGTLVSLSTSLDWSISCFSNLHLILVS
jgi:hypothetical protein